METIRYTLKHFDLEHPDMAIFPHDHGLPKTETKREIYQQYCRGDSVQALARRFCQAPSRIYRIIKDMRTARIMALPLDCIGNEQFARLPRRRRRPRSWGHCRKAICRRRSRGCPAVCPRIWPACTRCPC